MLQANKFSRQQFSDFLSAAGARIVGRNTYRQPSWYTIDFRVSKTFGLGASNTRLQVLVELFNMFNTKNEFVSGDNQNRFRATYTQNTDRYTFQSFEANFTKTNSYANIPDPRQIQFAVRLTF